MSLPASPPWERAVGLLGAALVVGLLVALALGGDGPAAPTAHLVAVDRTPGGWTATVEVHNQGGRAAQHVVVVGTLAAADAAPARAEATVDLLPGGGRQQVILSFDRDPSDLDLDVTAWTDP